MPSFLTKTKDMDKISAFLIDFFLNHESDFERKIFNIFNFILMMLLSLLFWGFMEGKVIMSKILDFNSVYLFITSGQIIVHFVILFAIS